MITLLCRELHRYTGDEFVGHFRDRLGGRFQVLSYEQVFRARALPVGHVIFSDFDRLTPFLREVAANMAAALRQVAPEARILNHPLRVKERYELLRALRLAGINDFDVARLDVGRRPERYPVFLRREDDALGPETALIEDAAAFDRALAELDAAQRPRKGRLWVEYRAQPGPDGLFRKFAAFRIGERIMPYHLQISEDWTVKSKSWNREAMNDAEELAFVRDDPHAETLRRVFDLAGIDYGRADYAVVDGQVRVYEVNTNPNMPKKPRRSGRAERRALVQGRFLDWMLALDTPVAAQGWVRFRVPAPVQERLPTEAPLGLGRLIAGRWLARSPRSARWHRRDG